jgi:predicted nuclease of restriction endonuclease-like (RecB) superfamily
MRSANRELLLLYYHIGRSLSDRVKSEEWGSKILERISADIQQEFPGIRGFSARNLKKMRRFYQEYNYLGASLNSGTPMSEDSTTEEGRTEFMPPVVAQLSNEGKPSMDKGSQGFHGDMEFDSQVPFGSMNQFIQIFLNLGFSHHFLLLNKCPEIEERYFYMQVSVKNQWSKRVLEYHIEAGDYRRKGKLTNNFQQSLSGDIKEHAIEAFKDEYLLDFLTTEDARSEPLLEKRIISKLKRFMMSLGGEFTFMGNQYRLIVGGDEFFVDLLFFHRTMRCMVVFELKT